MKISPVAVINHAAPVLGYLVPATEIVLVIYLCSGIIFTKYLRTALISSVILILIFEIYIVAMLLSGLDLPCSCGGVIAQLSWKQHVIFNGLFIIAGLAAILYDDFTLRLKGKRISSLKSSRA
ncbi:hypothetical protein QWZ17_27035 [Mucilaginibacter flavus]|nr:MauE/DoxX family redox-associated membrane protein [Mucilaginibacter flavus]MDN3584558.1 hypothetical protein [Mucilaginibacter flavus]